MLFIDGANWHYGLKSIGVDSGRLDYRRLARKLLIDRELAEIRYYVGRVSGDLHRVRRQDRFLRRLEEQGIHVFRGRVEKHWMAPERNPVIQKLREVMAARPVKAMFANLFAISFRSGGSRQFYVPLHFTVSGAFCGRAAQKRL